MENNGIGATNGGMKPQIILRNLWMICVLLTPNRLSKLKFMLWCLRWLLDFAIGIDPLGIWDYNVQRYATFIKKRRTFWRLWYIGRCYTQKNLDKYRYR